MKNMKILVAIIIGFLIIPGMMFVDGAKKSEQKGVTSFTGTTTECGSLASLVGTVRFHTKTRDNGNFQSHINMKGWVIKDGQIIGSFQRTENTHGSLESLPMSIQIANTITCHGSGVQKIFNVGCTIQKDTTVKCHNGFINF